MKAFNQIRRRLRVAGADERGFTVVEGVVAAMLLVIGVLGTLQLFDAGARNTYRAEESQVVNDRLQAELETIRRLPYNQIALTGTPVHQNDANDPRWRVSGTQYALARDGDLGSLAQMAFNGAANPGGGTVSGGSVNPGPTPFKAGDVKGKIYRFVSWTSDPSCAACGPGAMKRIVVAATIDEAPISFERAFQEVHTDVVDPEITPDPISNPPPDPEATSAQFWLTDTTCNNTARQPITANHLTHNTRGICSQGLGTGTTRGAPDLMFTQAPSVADAQATFDYATDSEPAQNADQDIGILMPKTTFVAPLNCTIQSVVNTLDIRRLLDGIVSILNISAPSIVDGVLDLVDGTDKHKRIHTWVTPPVQGSGGVLLGRGTLDLYTQTINGAVHPGKICVWMSVRQNVTIPRCLVNLLGICVPVGSSTIAVDLPFINVGLLSNGECRTGVGLNLTHFPYSRNPWPKTWEKISLPLCFAAINAAGAVVPAILPPSSRVVLSIMVDGSGMGSGQGLEFMYDAVGYESRLGLETSEIISF